MSVEFVQILFSISCFAIFKNFSAFDNQFSVQKYFFFFSSFCPVSLFTTCNKLF